LSLADRLDGMTLAQVNDRQGELVDAVVAGFAEVAAAQARCAELVEELRCFSEAAAGAAARRAGKEQADGLDHRYAERSVTAELACALRLPEMSATALLAESQSLVHEHPATMAGLRAGEVSYRHAVTVLNATVGLEKESVRELDVLLAEQARTLTVARLKKVARRERERRDSRPMRERHRVAAQDRRVELQPCDDGMAWLHQLLPAVQATAIFHRLTDIAAAVQGPEEPRTLAQLRADASVDLLLDDDARAALAAASGSALETAPAPLPAPARSTGPSPTQSAGDSPEPAPTRSIAGVADKLSLAGIKAQVAVTVPVMTLLGLAEEPGDLAGHGPIDPDTARRLAAQAPSFLRLLTHPETGAVLSVGRDRYTVPADLKAWLRVRDETCRFPGCSRRAERCDIDHITNWAHGGTTDHHNLIHLCRKHHRLKHTTPWTVSTEPPEMESPPDRQSRALVESRHGPDSPAAGPAATPGIGSAHSPAAAPRANTARSAAWMPSADVVHWTAPSGRTYLDRAATEIARSNDEKRDAPRTVSTDRGPSSFPEEPPF
jgi:hypothetical protein